MKTTEVYITIDMIKIEPMGDSFKSVLWTPFDKDTPVCRVQRSGKSLKEIEEIVAELVEHYKPLAKARMSNTGDKFNGYRVCATLLKGQRKPNGWAASRKLRIEKEL